VADLLAERYGVITCFAGDKVCMSKAVELPFPDSLTSYQHRRATLRSWNGNFDRDEALSSDLLDETR
jgi:hypothetical protein